MQSETILCCDLEQKADIKASIFKHAGDANCGDVNYDMLPL